MAQLIDAGLLLGQQFAALNRGLGRCDAVVEWTFPTQMSNVGGADHNFGRHAADVDTGATDDTALNQCDLSALLDGLQRGRHRRAAAADDSNVQVIVCLIKRLRTFIEDRLIA